MIILNFLARALLGEVGGRVAGVVMLMMKCAEGNRFWICFDAHDQVLVTQAGVNKIISFEVL